VVAQERFVGVFLPDTGEPVRSGNILPEFAADPRTGQLYAVWEDSRGTRSSGLERNQILFTTSSDGGRTWSKPLVRVNQTPTSVRLANQQAFVPSIAVAPNGTVGVTYYDFRNDTPAGGTATDAWLVQCAASCTDAGNWVETHVAGPFDLSQAPVARGYFLGDYQALATLGESFAPFFVQAVSRLAGNPTDAFFTTVPALG